MKNYYEVLEVDKNARPEIIKAAYKIHIKKNHPDLFQGDEKIKAEEKIKIINEAYEILSDEKKREEYDNTLKNFENDLYEVLLRENEQLKELLEEKLSIEESVEPIEKQEQYCVPNASITEQNNTKYLMKLIWRERLLRFIWTITIVVAIIVGIYKLTGINILENFWRALIQAI